MSSPGAAIAWVVLLGFLAVSLVGEQWRLSEFWQWVFFITLAPIPFAGWRFYLKERNNIFDILGYVGGAGAWLAFMWLVKEAFGLSPLSLAVGGALGLLPAIGIYGLFGIPAFVLDKMPKWQKRPRKRRQMPHSVPNDEDYDFDPSAFGVGSQGPQSRGGDHRQASPGGQSSWAAIIETLLIGHDASPDKQAEEQRSREQADAARKQREAREQADAEREARQRQQEEAKRLQQRSADDDYRDALETLGLKDGCTKGQVRTRYRELSKQVHSDAGGSDALFRKVKEAFEIVSKRAD